ncbi:NAD(P)H-quinone oxidoreductase [Rhizobium sp. YS-1r]|uniref:NAD(P)H-quinone oxidoreductase n=1 Tax=Rhizobium sp. YS-1r TaxID=1532558 RepID=UPI00050E7671|nr:NAD(P)H-quinone oxidoreductase [Rhizobium sp. YS-1r]KGE01920.1 NAD(P)H-quinone oxidoreductase [Rhizobium sp. YS-1r]
MTSTMQAVIAKQPGGPEVLELINRPCPVPGDGEMLVRVRAAGINRPDVMQRQGNYPPPPGASDVLGLELAGTVEAVGPNVQRFKQGDRVMALVHSGAYADWAIVQEGATLPIPDCLEFIEAAAFPETFFTVWSNVFERARLAPGETILIHGGTSGIGTTAISLAKALGSRVIATAGSHEKCKACLDLGADAAINYRGEDFVTECKALTDGRGPDVILDMVGGDYIARNLEAIAVDGRIAQIAFLGGAKAEVDFTPLLMKRVTLTGSTLRARPIEMKAKLADTLRERVLPLIEAGKVKPLIDSVFPLEDVQEAHGRMDAGTHIGKIVLSMQNGEGKAHKGARA